MRIKKFVDKTMSRLLIQIKSELGEDALILSSSPIAGGYIEIVAAIEDKDLPENYANNQVQFDDTVLRQKLSSHQVAEEVLSSLLSTCRQFAKQYNLSVDADVLNKVLDDKIAYYDTNDKPKIFIGSHGSGKTSVLLKMALKAKQQGRQLTIIDMDVAGQSKLKIFAEAMGADFFAPEDIYEMANTALFASGAGKTVLIDTASVNPFIVADMNLLRDICKTISLDKYLVWDSVYNAEDSLRAANIFIALGVANLIPTKLDLAYNLGGLLSLAYACKLKLGVASVQANITKGLAKVDNKALVRLLLA